MNWIKDIAERLTWEDLQIIGLCVLAVAGLFLGCRLMAYIVVALGL